MIEYFSEEKVPPSLAGFFDKLNQGKKTFSAESRNYEYASGIRVVLIEKTEYKTGQNPKSAQVEIICDSPESGLVKVILTNPWLDILKLAWKGSVLNMFNVKITKENSGSDSVVKRFNYTIHTTPGSLVVLEPDFLFDVTDISECFLNEGFNPNLFFLKKFVHSNPSAAMLGGNLINLCLDELFTNPEIEFTEIFQKGLAQKPLQTIYVALDQPNEFADLKFKVLSHFQNLKEIIHDLKYDYFSIEPTFISPKYGLQGRLDVMLEYESEPNRKNIIELKSGAAPNTNITQKLTGGQIVSTGVWNNNFAQTSCYNLLLDSTFTNRTGDSQILYSNTQNFPLRNAPNNIQKKQEILNLRNWLIALEYTISKGKNTIFNEFCLENFGIRQIYTEKDIKNFEIAYSSATPIETDYFNTFTSFITRELFASKTGSSVKPDDNGFSSLWKDSIIDKQQNFSILGFLKINYEESDFNSWYLCLNNSEKTSEISVLRKGDMCILYGMDDEGISNPVSQQIIKCAIKEITPLKIIITLRNKSVDKRFFQKTAFWALEPDCIDSNNKNLFQSLFNFLTTSSDKKNLLLGIKMPEINSKSQIQIEELNENQNDVLNKALSAKDYF
jgi:DNA replication ATP-dependent helicase Dna2